MLLPSKPNDSTSESSQWFVDFDEKIRDGFATVLQLTMTYFMRSIGFLAALHSLLDSKGKSIREIIAIPGVSNPASLKYWPSISRKFLNSTIEAVMVNIVASVNKPTALDSMNLAVTDIPK